MRSNSHQQNNQEEDFYQKKSKANIPERTEAQIRQVNECFSRMCKIYRNIDLVIDDESYFTQEYSNIVGYIFIILEKQKLDTGKSKISPERQIPTEITRVGMFFSQRYNEHFFIVP